MYFTAHDSVKMCKHFQKHSSPKPCLNTLWAKIKKKKIIHGVRKKISSMTDHSHIIPKSESHGLWM